MVGINQLDFLCYYMKFAAFAGSFELPKLTKTRVLTFLFVSRFEANQLGIALDG